MDMDGICYSLYDLDNEEYLANLEKRGIHFEYLTLKNKELVPYKGRNSRENRVKPVSQEEIMASKVIKKPNKVKPGYKKKIEAKRKEIASKYKGGR